VWVLSLNEILASLLVGPAEWNDSVLRFVNKPRCVTERLCVFFCSVDAGMISIYRVKHWLTAGGSGIVSFPLIIFNFI
jgi:hypothetical protein